MNTETTGTCRVDLHGPLVETWQADWTPRRPHACLEHVQGRLHAMFALGVITGWLMVAWAWAAWQQIQAVAR